MPDTLAPDTIVAISTPPGRGGIGIVRLSGPQAVAIAQSLTQLTKPLEPARATFARVMDADGVDARGVDANSVLDEALVTAFFAPHSYTGEDLVEIAAHGSPVVLQRIVELALAAGAVLAQPGEFSQRAFLSGRLDLTQAEAIHDLIAAQTLTQARTAAQQLGGALARRIAPVKKDLLHLVAFLEAGMDFASGELDDVEALPQAAIAARLAAVQEPLSALAASYRHGALQRNGLRLALVGKPNAGKSSLFNRLLAAERAIVTASPGTTRDTVEETFALDGIPVRLIDTAGLRTAANDHALDEAEALGIARSREALADADLVLHVVDLQHVDPQGDDDIQPLLNGRAVLRVLNKLDRSAAPPQLGANEVAVSALTGSGIDSLRAAILAQVRGDAAAEETAINNLRQREAVLAALSSLETAAAANAAGLPHEVVLIDLRTALAALDQLTGQTTTDDILALIFSQFCIGK